MQTLHIQHPVAVKALLTEELREELLSVELSAAGAIAHQLSTLQAFAATEESFETQRRLLLQQSEVEHRVARLEAAPAGEPFTLRVVQALVPLNVGDNFLEKMAVEIILEDGVVVALTALDDPIAEEPPQLQVA